MATIIYTQSEQANGQFDNGAIQENKPLGFPHEGGSLKPFSNLFYWAHAWSDRGGLIGEHPHKGFEIMSFVLKGAIEHYDSNLQGWKKLEAGDVQIIRAGRGISHAERFLPGAHIFQVWLDPNLTKTLSQPASYDDYRSVDFPVSGNENFKVKLVKGENSPLQMDTKLNSIKEVDAREGRYQFPLNKEHLFGIYLIDGKARLNENIIDQDSFALVSDEEEVSIEILQTSKLFIMEFPRHPGYETYAELQGISAAI